jgi:hypothetical protein
MDLTDELIAITEAKLKSQPRDEIPTKSGSIGTYLSGRAMSGQDQPGVGRPLKAFPNSPRSKTFPAEFKVW